MAGDVIVGDIDNAAGFALETAARSASFAKPKSNTFTVTGRRAFDAHEVADTLAAILMRDPDWNALPATTPRPIRTLLKACLEKNRRNRIGEIAVARFAIGEAASEANDGTAASVTTSPSTRLWRKLVPWAVAVASVAFAAFMVALSAPWRTPTPLQPVRLQVGLGADVSLTNLTLGASAILSPDGTTLAFVAQGTRGTSQLYIRRLDQLSAAMLAGTDDASSPFFSPDGQWIAFFAGTKLKKISVTGGSPVVVCDVDNPRGGSWADDGSIILEPIPTNGGTLMRVSSYGGTPEPLLKLADGEGTQRWPQALPGGKAVIFTSHTTTGAGYEDASIVVQVLPDGPRRVLHRGGYYGRYLPSGHIVWVHEGTLFAAPFDLSRLELTGSAVPAVADVTSGPANAASQFAVSDTGTLVYLPAAASAAGAAISLLDSTGKISRMGPTSATWSDPRFSPDGRQLAIDMLAPPLSIWIYDWVRDTLTRLTVDPSPSRNPVWTPDGRRLTFASSRGDKLSLNLYWQRADGSGDVQRLTESVNQQYPSSWHPNGRVLAFFENTTQTGADLMMLPVEGDEASGWKSGKATPFLNTPANERNPMFSPDGHWLAYESNESGRYEVYVRPFPAREGKWQISTAGGTIATWSRARHELFYETGDQHIMVVPYTVDGDSFRADKPRLWTETRFLARGRQRDVDLHPDGQRFAVAVASEQTMANTDKVVFVYNFFDELRHLAPPRKQ